jgi:hypothetical protein
LQSFGEFYPYYLCEHQQPRTKLFHFLATFNELTLLLNLILFSSHQSIIYTILLILLQVYDRVSKKVYFALFIKLYLEEILFGEINIIIFKKLAWSS